jgi:hypothetical protein
MKKPRYKFRFYRNWSSSYIEVKLIPSIVIYRLRWKDKFESPRVEQSPGFMVSWFGFQISMFKDQDELEKWLWVTKYSETKSLEDYPWKEVK